MNSKLDKASLQKIRDESFKDKTSFVSSADKWLRENGIITPVLHNNIIINLYVNFPKAKYIEYFMDPEAKQIEIYFHLSKVRFILTNEVKLERQARKLITEYLPDFTVSARKRKFDGSTEG